MGSGNLRSEQGGGGGNRRAQGRLGGRRVRHIYLQPRCATNAQHETTCKGRRGGLCLLWSGSSNVSLLSHPA